MRPSIGRFIVGTKSGTTMTAITANGQQFGTACVFRKRPRYQDGGFVISVTCDRSVIL